MPHCRAKNVDGSPCRAPERLVNAETGFCWTHSVPREERLRAARRGGETARARARKLVPSDLPDLDSPEAALAWTDAIGRAVAVGGLSGSQAQAALRAVSEFLKAFDALETQEQVRELRRQVADLKAVS